MSCARSSPLSKSCSHSRIFPSSTACCKWAAWRPISQLPREAFYSGDGKKLDPNKINWNAATTKNLTYQQLPGPENSYSVYMHDTPSQSLFGQNFRATSSGCVRVQGIEHLAAWLTADKGWRPVHIQQMKQTGERLDVKLKKPIPLYFVYITAWATEDGVVQFRRDLYQKDGIGAVAFAYLGERIRAAR
jgi:murein L,D-transpeptidase YcbB/YkuD